MSRQALFVFAPFFAVTVMFGQRAWALSSERTRLDEENRVATEEIALLAAKVARIEPLRAELRALEENVDRYIRILPSPEVATEERLLEMVQSVRERSGFAPESFSTLRGKQERRSAAGFVEIGLQTSGTGSHEHLLRFLNLLERQETFVRVNAFSARASEPGEDSPPPLEVTLDLSTFRYEAGR